MAATAAGVRDRNLRTPAILLVAGLGASLASWFSQLLGIRSVGAVGATVFIAGWSAFFSITAGYAGLQQETTRALSLPEGNLGPTARTAALITGAVGVAAGALMLSIARLGLSASLTLLAAVGWVAAAVLAGIVGAGVARHSIGLAALTMLGDALLRLGLFAFAYARGWDSPTTLVGLAAAASVMSLLVLLPLGGAKVLTAHMGAARQTARRVGEASVAAVLAAVLITGAPLLVNALGSMSGIEEARVLSLLSLTRAPVLLPIVALQSWLLKRFVLAQDLPKTLLLAFGLVSAIALAAATLALVLGQAFVTTAMGSAFAVPGRELAVLVLSSACLGYLMVVSLAAIARDRHRVSVWLWALTLVLTAGSLALAGSSTTGVALALGVPTLVVSLVGAAFLAGRSSSRPHGA